MAETSFDLKFLAACLDASIVSITPTAQTNFFTDDYSGKDMVFTYNPFTISPDYCGSSVFCNNVLGPLGVAVECKELDIND